METLASGPRNFQNNSTFENKPMMSSVLVCPNCRSTLPPCVAIPYPVAAASPTSASCQGCHQSVSGSCLGGGVVSHFSLPYVCRHWMQVSHSSPCSHGAPPPFSDNLHPFHPLGTCTQPPPQIPFSLSQTWPAQESVREVPKQGGNVSPLSHKDSLNRFSVSPRGGSPEGTLILPVLLAGALNGALVAAKPPSKPWTAEDDARVLAASKEALEESGWYYGALSWQEAAALLANTSEGTFLVRDSSSSHCPYALSVQTPQGPTSIRVEYERGKFWLACEKKGVTPQLGGVIELVEFYKALAKNNQKDISGDLGPEDTSSGARHVWIDHRGKVFSPIRVVQPLRKGPPSLQHLCRLASRGLSASQVEALPPPLKTFLQNYQHDL